MIKIHWHLILYIIVMAYLLYKSGQDKGHLDFTPILAILGMIILTAIYGGIFWW